MLGALSLVGRTEAIPAFAARLAAALGVNESAAAAATLGKKENPSRRPYELTDGEHALIKRLVGGNSSPTPKPNPDPGPKPNPNQVGGRPIGTAVEAGGDGGFGRAVPLSFAFAEDVAAALVPALSLRARLRLRVTVRVNG